MTSEQRGGEHITKLQAEIGARREIIETSAVAPHRLQMRWLALMLDLAPDFRPYEAELRKVLLLDEEER